MNTTPIEHKIEFMAWDDELKKLGEVYGFDKYKASVTFDIGTEDDAMYELPIRGNLHLLQLTALRSINDEPIYNHMIVKDEFGNHFVVDMFNYNLMHRLDCNKLEIVGNRFQHPHLLELCK